MNTRIMTKYTDFNRIKLSKENKLAKLFRWPKLSSFKMKQNGMSNKLGDNLIIQDVNNSSSPQKMENGKKVLKFSLLPIKTKEK